MDDIGDIPPPATKMAKTVTPKRTVLGGNNSTIGGVPNRAIRLTSYYFDGSSEKKFSFDAMLDDSVKDLLQKCKFAYVALQCILPEALIMVKEGWILPMDATVRELSRREIFRFLNPETMNDSVPIYCDSVL